MCQLIIALEPIAACTVLGARCLPGLFLSALQLTFLNTGIVCPDLINTCIAAVSKGAVCSVIILLPSYTESECGCVNCNQRLDGLWS